MQMTMNATTYIQLSEAGRIDCSAFDVDDDVVPSLGKSFMDVVGSSDPGVTLEDDWLQASSSFLISLSLILFTLMDCWQICTAAHGPDIDALL